MKTIIGLFFSTILFGAVAQAQTTAFTYQGKLNNNGAPASGIYDLQFTVYDAVTNGTAVGPSQTAGAVGVSNGLFTTQLDFGANVFNGSARWLDIGVRTNGDLGAFTVLSPRQTLTSTPYAIQAGNAVTAVTAGSANSVAATNINGTINLSQLPGSVLTNNADGAGLQNLNSYELTGALSVSHTPVNISHIYHGGAAYGYGVAVSGNYTYLANGDDGLRIYDMSNPANPTNVGYIDNGGTAFDIAVSGNYAYLANYNDGLRIYDISNPASPVNLGHIDNGREAYGVAVSGNYAYLANHVDGLRIYDISNPANPVNVGHIFSGGAAYGVAVSGNYAYLANGDDGLRIYDISNPASPVNLGHIYNSGTAWGIAVSGNYAYLANNDDGLRIYDISNPASPVNLGHIDDGGVAYDIAVSGNYAYLANSNDGLRIYNINNPANPFNVGHIYNGGAAYGVAVSGNYAYLANSNDGLRIYGLGVATAPGFQGDGSLLTGINAANIASGILPDARLSGNVSLLGQSIESSEITDGTIATVDIADNAVNNSKISDVDAAKIVSGTIDDARLSANVSLLGQTIESSEISSVDGAKITSGTIADERLSGNVALRDANQTFSGNNTFSGPVGIGSSNSLGAALYIAPSSAGSGNNTADFFAPAIGGNHSHIHYGQTGDWFIRSATNTGKVILQDSGGNVGIGTSSPAAKLDVNGGINVTGPLYINSPGFTNTTAIIRARAGDNLPLAVQTVGGSNLLLMNTNGTSTFSGNVFGVSFNPTSDRNAKENFTPVDNREVLEKVATLAISQWNFKGETNVSHVGPMAQDFHSAFGLGVDDRHIATVDADGVALAAIQGLNQKLEAKESKIQQLEKQNHTLEQRLSDLEKLVQKLSEQK